MPYLTSKQLNGMGLGSVTLNFLVKLVLEVLSGLTDIFVSDTFHSVLVDGDCILSLRTLSNLLLAMLAELPSSA